MVTGDDQAHALVLAPARTGKTTGYMAPAVLASSRTAIVTSSKVDDLLTTIPWRVNLARRTGGRVYLLNLGGVPMPELPAGVIPCRHDPIAGCTDTTWTQRCAQVLISLLYEGKSGGSDNSKFFQTTAQSILEVYLHAAAIAKRNVSDVLKWINTRAVDEPSEIVRSYRAAPGWVDALHDAVHGGATQTTANFFSTVYTAVRPWTDPKVAAQLREPNFTVDRFLANGISTLYVLDTNADGRMSPIAPVVVTLIERIVAHAYRRAATVPGGQWEPGLLLALDELANIAPLPSLPAICSQGASQGVVTAFALQDMPQLAHRYGPEVARTIVGNVAHHLVFGRVGPDNGEYLRGLSDAVGTWDREEHSHSHEAGWQADGKKTISKHHVQHPILPLADFQRTPERQAIAVTHLTPWLADLPGWWDVPWCARRGWDPRTTSVGQMVDHLADTTWRSAA